MASLLLVMGVAFASGLPAAPPAKELPPLQSLPAVEELPDPFAFTDGTRVRSRDDWARRRAELKEIIQQYAYGHLPPAGKVTAAEQVSNRNEEIHATVKEVLLRVGPGGKLPLRLFLTLPDGKGPFPTIVDGDACWGRIAPEIAAEVAKRGYALAEFDRTEIVPDKNERTTGLHELYPNADFGALAAWAWGYHRVVDYLLTLPEVDHKRIVVTGHSRGGKTALLAGAMDERIALTAPNNSGCMGAGCTRFPHGGETLDAITKTFPYWFSPVLPQFVGHESQLPFDQHTLKALVAPRALLSTEARGDTWANPPGTQLTYQAAKVVYSFLGAADKIGIAYRDGGHQHGLADWKVLLDFADWQLRGQKPARRFDELPYPDESATAIKWRAPGQTR